MPINNYKIYAPIYAKNDISKTGYLAFKHVPKYIKQFANGPETLDFGCGTGRSTRFLNTLGLNVEGVDIDPDMIKEAEKRNDNIPYQLIENGILPYENNTFDIVFSALVFFEIATKDEITAICNEINRILKDNGVFIFVTGSAEMYNYNWLSLDVDYPENKNLSSGSIAKIRLIDVNLELFDYFWTDDDYHEVISKSNFKIVEKNYPLGDADDGIAWAAEQFVSPYVTYILKKNP